MTFFLNLHNFVILFGLCKLDSITIPKSDEDWDQYSKSVTIKVSQHIFSAFEIKHCILRASMGPPKNFYFTQEYPIYMADDPKVNLKCSNSDPLVNFGISYPYKSSPALTFFTVENIRDELKGIAGNCITSSKFGKTQKRVILPGIMENYEDDFYINKDRSCIVNLFTECLKDVYEKYEVSILNLYDLYNIG